MASVKSVIVNGIPYQPQDGTTVTVVVADGPIERHIGLSDTIDETIFDEDGNERDSSSSEYEDLHSLVATDYDIDEDLDEDDYEEEYEEDEDYLEDEDEDDED